MHFVIEREKPVNYCLWASLCCIFASGIVLAGHWPPVAGKRSPTQLRDVKPSHKKGRENITAFCF